MAFLAPVGAAIGSAASFIANNIGVGTLLQAGGALLTGLSAVQQARQQAAEASANAQISRFNAETAAVQGAIEARKARLRSLEARGEQRAILARAGVEVDEGSPFVLTETTAREHEHEIDLLKRAKDIEAAGLLYEAARYRAQARQIKSTIPLTLLGTAIQTARPFFSVEKK